MGRRERRRKAASLGRPGRANRPGNADRKPDDRECSDTIIAVACACYFLQPRKPSVVLDWMLESRQVGWRMLTPSSFQIRSALGVLRETHPRTDYLNGIGKSGFSSCGSRGACVRVSRARPQGGWTGRLRAVVADSHILRPHDDPN